MVALAIIIIIMIIIMIIIIIIYNDNKSPDVLKYRVDLSWEVHVFNGQVGVFSLNW